MTKMTSNIRITCLLATALTASLAWADEVPATPEHVVGEAAYPFDTVDTREEKKESIELPDSVAPKLGLLTKDEIEFLKSGDARKFAGSPKDTVEELDKRTPEEVKAWVNAMQHVISEHRYEEGRDLPNIPFNTESPQFNAWHTERPRSMDPKREDGPIALGRYDGRGGPPTFGGHPLA